MKVAPYIRVSTSEQAQEGWSVPEQIDRLTKYCDSQRWDIYDTYVDAGYTGTNMNRPGLQRLIKDIDNIDKVVVYKLDRLSRSQKDTLTLIEDIFIPNKTDLVSMNESFDTATPFGRFMIGILSSFAQLEKTQILERMMMGKEARAKTGKWHGGVTPIGYDYKDGQLVVNDYYADVVRKIFDMYNSGMGARTIERELDKQGIRTPSGKLFTASRVRYCLKKRIYTGYIESNGNIYKGEHEAIVSEEVFLRAQRRLNNSVEEFATKGIKTGIYANTTLLGGFCWCAKCGARYGKGDTGKGRTRRSVYKCYSRHKKVKSMIKDPNCKNKTWEIPDLDNMIISEIKGLKWENVTKTTNNIPKLKNQLQKIEKQIDRIITLYSLGKYDLKDLDRYVLPLEEQKKGLELEIRKEEAALNDKKELSMIDDIDDILDNGSLEKKRELLELLINRIILDDEDITIEWKFN